MLTESEKNWLERRKNSVYINEWGYPCSNPLSYDRLADFIDAAEFEARVAVLLTDRDAPYVPPCHIVCNHRRKCRACRLMYARLAVEQEMDDADRK